ncbi:MAG: ABC transporter substrate-binding protein, partial [Acidobacteriota bacterium]
GRYSELETTFRYQALCELIEDYFRGGESSYGLRGAPELDDVAPDLLHLYPAFAEIPELRTAAGAEAPAGDGVLREETVVFELIATTLIRLADHRPMVLVLEDLHTGDSGLEALQYLVRRLGGTPTLVIGTYRPGEIDRAHPLSRVLASFEGDARFEHLTLGPLDARGTRELAESLLGGPALDTSVVEQLWEATEGNPLFCRELIRALVESKALRQDDLGLWSLDSRGPMRESLPITLRQAEERRLEQLEDGERRLLAAASVLGRDFEIPDLLAIIDGGDAEEEGLDRLVDRGLLKESRSPRGRRLLFTSGILRNLLEDGLTRRRRRRLHERAAARLERRWAGRLERVLPKLVEHCRSADLPEKTVSYGLELARRSLELSSAKEAAKAARIVLEFAEDLDGSEGQLATARATAILAKAAADGGDSERSLRFAGEAADLFHQLGERAEEARASLMAADIAWSGRQVDAVRRWVSRGIEAARGGEATEALERLSALGITLANLHGERSEALYLEEIRAQELSGPEVESVRTQPGGRLVASLPLVPHTVDPSRVQTTEEWEIAANLFETLLGTDEHGLLVPSLCETWRASSDHCRFSFTLRPDLRLSDGSAVSAEMVKAAFERSARWQLGEPPPAFSAVAGIESFLAGENPGLDGVQIGEKIGGREQVHFRLRQPLPIFPALLTDLRTAFARANDPGHLLGTGPFRLVSASADHRRWQLEPNPHYRGRRPSIEALDIVVPDDPWSLGAAFRAGDIDLVGDMAGDDLDDLVKRPELRRGLVEAIKKNTYFTVLHSRVPQPLRQALCGAVQARDLVWPTLGRRAVPAFGLIPPGLLGHEAARERPALSVTRAVEKLDAAGIERPVTLKAAVHPHFFERFAPLLHALLAAWERLGVHVEVINEDLDGFISQWLDPVADLLVLRWGAAYEDPDNFTHNLLNSRTGLLRHYFSSPEADLLLERARLETRASSREVLYRRFETLLADEGAVLPLFHEVEYRLLAPRWTGLHLSSRAPYVDYTRLALRAEDASPAPPVQGELRVAQPSMLELFDPAAANVLDHHEVALNVFEPLARIDENAGLEPWLAESIEPQLGGRAFRIRLRRGVRFHDGRHLGSRDVRFSFERLIRDKPHLRHLLAPVRGAHELATGLATELTGCRIHSDIELTLELLQPMPSFVQLLAHPCLGIIPDGRAPDPSGSLVGTGPFRLARWLPGERAELERHPHYWRTGLPKVDRLIFVNTPDPEERLTDFEEGRLSILSDLTPESIERLRRRGGYPFESAPALTTFYLALNRRNGPLMDPERRAALYRGLFVEDRVRSLGRVASPARTVLPPGLLGYERTVRPTLGTSTSHGLDGVRLRLAVHPVYGKSYRRFSDDLIADIEALGIDVEVIRFTDIESLVEHTESGEIDILLSRWSALYPDADGFISPLVSRAGGFLAAMLAGDDLEDLVAQARHEGDPALRHHLYHRLEERLAREHLIRPLFHDQVYRFAQPQVRGLHLFVTAPQVRYGELSLAPT